MPVIDGLSLQIDLAQEAVVRVMTQAVSLGVK
jgi:hypothetical protein